jgi:hypothetical protein
LKQQQMMQRWENQEMLEFTPEKLESDDMWWLWL